MPGLTTTDTEPVAPAAAATERPRSLTADVLPYVAVVGVAGALATGEDEVTGSPWHFYPAVDERSHDLFAGLDWSHAVVVHERVD